jgi:hypothetical protein
VWSIYMDSSYCFTSSRHEPVYCFLLERDGLRLGVACLSEVV